MREVTGMRSALLVLALLVLPAHLAGALPLRGEPGCLRVSARGQQWELARLAADRQGWRLTTLDGRRIDLAPGEVKLADVALPGDAEPLVLRTTDGDEVRARRARFANGSWRLADLDRAYWTVRERDVARLDAPLYQEPPVHLPVVLGRSNCEPNPFIMRLDALVDYGHHFYIANESVRIQRGKPTDWPTSKGVVEDLRYAFEVPLEREPGYCYLTDVVAHPEAVWSVRQPVKANGYTCRVDVRDFADGHHPFGFVLRRCTQVDPPDPNPPPDAECALRRLSFTVPASEVWVDTGWQVKAGTEIIIGAKGQWDVLYKGKMHKVGGGGIPSSTRLGHLLKHEPCGALIARTAISPAFHVGVFHRRTLPKGGRLMLSQNGLRDEIAKSRGELTVVVQGMLRRAPARGD